MKRIFFIKMEKFYLISLIAITLFFNSEHALGQGIAHTRPGYNLKIVSPKNGEIFYAGNKVNIKIIAEGSPPINFVMISYYGNIITLDKQPFEKEILIPPDFLGKFPIRVSGFVGEVYLTNITAEDGIEVLIKKREKLVSISSQFETIGLHDKFPWQLQVEGKFEDGTTIDISSPDTGTTYESSNPSFISVAKDGKLELRSQLPGYNAREKLDHFLGRSKIKNAV